jgi:type IV pilus assembly protein PilB
LFLMSTKKRLGELLIDAGVIDEAMLQSALGHQRRWGGRIGQAMLDLKLTTEATIVQALARKLGFEVARLGALDPQQRETALKMVGRDFAVKHNIFPMAADHSTLTVAMADPTNLAIVDELRFRFNKRVKVCIGGDREISEGLRAQFPSSEPLALEAISLDNEVSGEFLPPLADPFGGGNSDLLEKQMERSPRQGAVRPGLPGDPAWDSRSELLGSVPRGGFSNRDTAEELELSPLQVSPAPRSNPAPVAPRTTTQTQPVVAVPPVAPRTTTQTQPVVAVPPVAPRTTTQTHPVVAPPPVAAPRTTTQTQPVVASPVAPRPTGTHQAVPPPMAPRTTGTFQPPAPVQAFTPVPRPAPHPIPPPVVTELVLEEEAVEGRIALRPLTPKEVVILDALERLAAGQDDVPLPVKPNQVAAALLRIMLRHKIVTQQELLDELLRK